MLRDRPSHRPQDGEPAGLQNLADMHGRTNLHRIIDVHAKQTWRYRKCTLSSWHNPRVGCLGLFVLCSAAFAFAQSKAGSSPVQAPSSPTATSAATPSSSSKPPTTAGVVRGKVRDSAGTPAADAAVFLRHAREVPGKDGIPSQTIETQTVHTNAKGEFSFIGLAAGTYTLGATRTADEKTERVRVELRQDEKKTIDLAFLPDQPSLPRSDSPSQP
jgi:hypothetical protein